MTISTKTGDTGETSLWSGERCNKDNIRVEAYGSIDELNANISLAKHLVKLPKTKKILKQIQYDLFKVAGELASIKKYQHPIIEKDVNKITTYIYKIESNLTLKGFVIPGSTKQSAQLDVCRTIARRAERGILTLNREAKISKFLLQYINRLSDLLFILARLEEKKKERIEYHKW